MKTLLWCLFVMPAVPMYFIGILAAGTKIGFREGYLEGMEIENEA